MSKRQTDLGGDAPPPAAPVTRHGLGRRCWDWLQRQESARQVLEMGADEQERLSHELGLGNVDPVWLLTAPPAGQTLLPSMMVHFGVEAAGLGGNTAGAVRDMQRVCAACPHKRKCARALAAGASAETCRGFCPNATTLDELATYAVGRAGR